MPFTPFHLGFGALIKSFGPKKFSFMVFGGSQVLMDLEPGIRMAVGTPLLHGFSHTILGALIIGLLATFTGKPVSEWVFRKMGRSDLKINWGASWAAAFTGTLSHIVMDSIMHADMSPLAPLTDANGLLGVISLEALHLTCLGFGILGGAILLFRMVLTSTEKGSV